VSKAIARRLPPGVRYSPTTPLRRALGRVKPYPRKCLSHAPVRRRSPTRSSPRAGRRVYHRPVVWVDLRWKVAGLGVCRVFTCGPRRYVRVPESSFLKSVAPSKLPKLVSIQAGANTRGTGTSCALHVFRTTAILAVPGHGQDARGTSGDLAALDVHLPKSLCAVRISYYGGPDSNHRDRFRPCWGTGKRSGEKIKTISRKGAKSQSPRSKSRLLSLRPSRLGAFARTCFRTLADCFAPLYARGTSLVAAPPRCDNLLHCKFRAKGKEPE